MIKKISPKKGYTYIEMCVAVLVFVIFLVFIINVFSIIATYVELRQVADDAITIAAYTGEFGSDYDEYIEEHDDYTVTEDADDWYNLAEKKVQLGDKMSIKISEDVEISVFGGAIGNVTVQVERKAISQQYWK